MRRAGERGEWGRSGFGRKLKWIWCTLSTHLHETKLAVGSTDVCVARGLLHSKGHENDEGDTGLLGRVLEGALVLLARGKDGRLLGLLSREHLELRELDVGSVPLAVRVALADTAVEEVDVTVCRE